MSGFDVCTACACYIKRHEALCPFCGAPHVAAPRAALHSRRRVSRAQWLAFGSTLAAAGCTTTSAEQGVDASTTTDAEAIHEAAADSTVVVDATADAVGFGVDAAGDVRDAGDEWTSALDGSCATWSGVFACTFSSDNDASCVPCGRGSHYCVSDRSNTPTKGCFDNGAGPFAMDPQCDAGSYCACFRLQNYGQCRCVDLDDAGAIEVSCFGCYGAPPARLERLAPLVS
jgi:hypothetical protein